MPETIHYPHILRAVASTPWAILPEKMTAIWDFLAFKAQGGSLSAEELNAVLGAASTRTPGQPSGSVAVLPVVGTIAHRANLLDESSGGTSVEALTNQFRALMGDPSVSAIVLDVDSPGGAVDGIEEFASEIYRARGVKPVVAVANSLMASAAYWLASGAEEIVASPSSLVGSIGVIAGHQDQSGLYEKLGVKVSLVTAGKYKAENNPFEPMTDEGRAAIQGLVDDAYGRFTKAVAKGRGVGIDAVRSGFGEGRVVSAREAVSLGMADRVATIDEVIAGLSSRARRDASATSAMSAELVAVPYAEHGQRVAADLAAFIAATRDRITYRLADDGRTPLSAAQRERLSALRADLDTLIAETDPARFRPVSAVALARARARIHDVDMLLADAG